MDNPEKHTLFVKFGEFFTAKASGWGIVGVITLTLILAGLYLLK